MSDYYILDENHNPVPVSSFEEYSSWVNELNDKVAKTEFKDGTYISTMFLGFNHNIFGEGKPILFEIMLFPRGRICGYTRRYTSWEAAERGHKEVVADWVLKIIPNDLYSRHDSNHHIFLHADWFSD